MNLHHDILEAAYPGQSHRFFLPISIGGTPALADEGAGLILSGIKTATSSAFWDYPDGRIPFTAEGRARWAATPDLTTERITGTVLGTDRVEDRSLTERCITSDSLLVPNALYNNYHRIVQAPGYVVIVSENMHDARVVPLGRQPHPGPAIRQWLGDSRGWWEGSTLVVETTNFAKEVYDPKNGGAMRPNLNRTFTLVERFTRTGPETLVYEVTVDDPETWVAPWTLQIPLARDDGYGMFEYACHEGNYAMKNMLTASRAGERGAGK